ncbi:MAG: transglycosylase domain-containing protein [Elusimicrobia bacterium]|nr:transglycosylase domain-containing protein [Elusimicrobiota bacterium]
MTRSRFCLIVLTIALCILASALTLRRFLEGLPSYQSLEDYTPSLTTRAFDVKGDLLAEFSIEKRALLTLSEIPVDLQNAVIATEDSGFFRHIGISPRGMLRAAAMNFLRGRVVQGGSTLTQQLAKLIFLTPERKIIRKIKEMLLSLQLERNFSKEEILQLYLNQIYFGHGAYGVQAAAHVYFGKDVKSLKLGECALLAGLIRFPGGTSPFTHPERAAARRKIVLQRMLNEGFIARKDMEEALSAALPAQRGGVLNAQAPYFVEYVRRQLEPKYGTAMLWRGGLQIHTTLDLSFQRIAEEEMEKALKAYDEKALAEWKKELDAEVEAGIDPPTVSTAPPASIQGVFILLDVKTGAIRAMIGGRGDQFNRCVQAKRQPGSTFKPFVWAAALNSGMTGMTLVEDTPLAYYSDGRDWRLLEGATDQQAIMLATAPFAGSEDFKVWVPSDFDGKFLGVITLRKALALSRNIASIRLIEHVGPPSVVELAAKAGIQSPLEPVLSLGLGSSVVTPLELAGAFSTFANGGVHAEPWGVVRVEDTQGKILEAHAPKMEEALSPQLAYLLTHLMKTVVQGGTGSGASRLKRPLAGKTGTTNDHRDLWFIGYTPDLLAAAWMGYDDFTSLGGTDWTGGTTVVPWWTNVMEGALKDYPPRDFPVPEDIITLAVDSETGLLALPTCPKRVLQAFLKGSEPKEYCSFDHSQPLKLRAGFSASGEMTSLPVSTAAPAGEEPTDLPSEEDLDNLYQ